MHGGLEAPGRPESPPIILALSEKKIRLIWAKAEGPARVIVHRVTDTRRIHIEETDATATEHGLAWTWEPPATRSTLRYQVVLESRPDHPVTLEVRDADWTSRILEKLALMEWRASDLTDEETEALTDIGLPVISSNSRRGRGPARQPARLTARSRDVGGGSVRVVSWDEEHPDLVVWRPGPTAGDVKIRAPRWWLSPAALTTDHGLLRFLDLFSEPPLAP